MITKWKYSAASAYQKVQLHSPQSEKFVFFFAMYSSAPQPRFRGVHSLREAPTRSRSTKRFRAPESGDTGYKESKSSPEQHYLQSNIISKHLQTYQIHPNAPKSNQSLKIYAPHPAKHDQPFSASRRPATGIPRTLRNKPGFDTSGGARSHVRTMQLNSRASLACQRPLLRPQGPQRAIKMVHRA
jgi:hypothetical protein